MTKQADLTAYIFEGLHQRFSDARHQSSAQQLLGELAEWMETSARFTAFVEVYRDKIRKKIRVTREAESVLDLRSELEVAFGLLNDRRLAVVYEPVASTKRRGPDFGVTYRDNLVFNIEVARIRGEQSGEAPGPQELRLSKETRIQRILLDKLGQMQPGMPNLLVILTREKVAQSIDLERLMQEIKSRAEGKDPAFYAGSRYASPAAFYKDFLHLSAVLLCGASVRLWANKQSRPGLDEKVLRLVALALQAPVE